MPYNKEYTLDLFRGMNRDGYKYNMSQDWLWDLVNCYIQVSKDGRGSIIQRDGLTKMNTTPLTDKIRHLVEARFDNGNNHIIARAGTKWSRFNTITSEFVDLITGRASDAKGMSTMYDNILCVVDGGVPQKVDQSLAVSVLSSDAAMPQDSTAVHAHGHRIWLNSPANPMKIYGSKAGAPFGVDGFSATNDSIVLDLSISLKQGDKVLGFHTLADQLLVVLLKNHIAVYYAPPTFGDIELVQIIPIRPLTQNASVTLSTDGAIPCRSGIKSLQSSRSFQRFDQDDRTGLIAPFYRELVKNAVDEESICGVYHHQLNHYYVTIQSASDSNTLVYHPALRQIVGIFRFHVTPYSWLETQDDTLYMGANDGFMYKYDFTKASDDGNAVRVYIEFPFLGTDNPTVYKAPREFEMLIEVDKDTDWTLEYSYPLEEQDGTQDSESYAFTVLATGSLWDVAEWDVAVWDGPGRRLYKTADLIGRGRMVGLRLTHNTLDAKIRIPWMILRTILEGDK